MKLVRAQLILFAVVAGAINLALINNFDKKYTQSWPTELQQYVHSLFLIFATTLFITSLIWLFGTATGALHWEAGHLCYRKQSRLWKLFGPLSAEKATGSDATIMCRIVGWTFFTLCVAPLAILFAYNIYMIAKEGIKEVVALLGLFGLVSIMLLGAYLLSLVWKGWYQVPQSFRPSLSGPIAQTLFIIALFELLPPLGVRALLGGRYLTHLIEFGGAGALLVIAIWWVERLKAPAGPPSDSVQGEASTQGLYARLCPLVKQCDHD
jgi:hypothetical protein